MTVFHGTPRVIAEKPEHFLRAIGRYTTEMGDVRSGMEHLAPFEQVLVAEFPVGHAWPKCCVAQTE
jgi:hypothetical protein